MRLKHLIFYLLSWLNIDLYIRRHSIDRRKKNPPDWFPLTVLRLRSIVASRNHFNLY